MKAINYILGACVASALLGACSVDRFPYDKFSSEQIESDPQYIKNANLGIYAYMKGTLSSSWINNAHRVMEYTGDNIALSGTTTDDLFYMYNYQRIDNGGRNNDFWLRSYRTNYSANLLITNSKEGVSAETDHYIGEAYFMRAMMHFYLVNVYGKTYALGSDNLGVPIKITSDVKDIPARSTVGEVYTQVIKDLEKAAELMCSFKRENYYASENAAYAALSRVYLYMGNNSKSIEYADKVIQSGKYSLLDADQYRTMNTLKPEQNSEAIFSIKYVTDLDEGDQYNGVGGFYYEHEGTGWGEMFASYSFIKSATYFPNDARQAFIKKGYKDITSAEKEGLFVRYVTTADGVVSPKYISGKYSDADGKEIITLEEGKRKIALNKRVSATGVEEYFFNEGAADTIVWVDKAMNTRNGFPKFYVTKCSLQENKIHSWSPSLFRYAEIYLNKAEALAKDGKTGEAIEALNKVRLNRGVPAYIAGDVVLGRGYSDLLDVILEERRLELAYEGHRAFDVFRNKKSINRNYPGTHATNASQLLEVRYDSKEAIQLLPLSQMNVQYNLVQNER